MSNSHSTNEQSIALQDLAFMVERQEGLDAAQRITSIYSGDGYPVVPGPLDEMSAVTHLAETFDPNSDDEASRVRIAGRINSMRLHSRFAFFDVSDRIGDTVQVIIPRRRSGTSDADDEMGSKITEEFIRESAYGDIIIAEGIATKSRSGEPSILTQSPMLRVAPAFISPDKIGTSSTAEEHAERVQRFTVRSKMKASIRNMLEHEGYIETITPVLSDVPSGANAEVFESRIESLDRQAFLRISPELALKTAIINGYSDKVYEFATNFRNEGIDREHSPEFEMLEFYAAHTSAEDLRDFTAKMVAEAAQRSLGTTAINLEMENGQTIGVDVGTWRNESYSDLLSTATGIDLDDALRLLPNELKPRLLAYIQEKFGETRAKSYKDLGAASLIDKLFKLTCRPHIQDPTFVERYPAIMVPLARPTDDNPAYVTMFQGIVGSTEVIKGYQELNDPVVQLSNLYAQAKAKAEGDTEAMTVDWRYMQAMLRGLPPTAGCGIGIDRLAAILNGTKNIHAAMPYPFKERFIAPPTKIDF